MSLALRILVVGGSKLSVFNPFLGLEENLALPSTGAEQDKEKNKRSVSGRLQIMIGSVQNLLGKKSAKNEVYVAVQIDNALQLRTRTKTKLEFNEVIDVHIDKANEVEIMVFDKNDGMLSILFFRLYDLREEFRQLRSSSGSVCTSTKVFDVKHELGPKYCDSECMGNGTCWSDPTRL